MIQDQRTIENQRYQDLLLTLQFVSATVVSNQDLQEILTTVISAMANVLGVEACALSEWDQENEIVSVLVEYGPNDWWDLGELTTKFNLAEFPATREVLQGRQARQMTINQLDIDPNELEYMQSVHIKTLLMLPMQYRDRVVGLVELMDDRFERIFVQEEIALVQLLANQLASAIEHHRLHEQAQREIVERKQVEVELRQSEARNRALLDVIPDLVFRISREGRYLDCKGNQTVGWPFPGQDCIGMNIRDILPAEIAALTLEYIHKTLDTNAPQIFEYRMQTQRGLQDYEMRLMIGGPDEVVGIVRNITEHKQAIHNEKLAALGKLASILAHEINNPLQAIQSHLDLILNYNLPLEKSKNHLSIIYEQVKRLQAITRPALNLARPTPTLYQPVSVVELIEQVLILIEGQLEHHRVQVVTDFQPVPQLLGASDQLIQVFLNLIHNAIEATAQLLHITVRAKEADVIITFTNNGPAISPELLPHLFEPYFTTKPEGNGLGLWISYQLVQQHGGILIVDNLPNHKGVVFTVKLPLKPSSESNL